MSAQATAERYTSFVALPFREHFSYRSRDILAKVIGAAVEDANQRGETKRLFEKPDCVDVPGGATPITDEIVQGIIESHFFIGDVTFENAGVLLETGIALGTKPADQIILITQGSHTDLHFDLRNNRVMSYSPDRQVASLASALIAAAQYFEAHVEQQVRSVEKRLSPEAILALNWYGRLQRDQGPAASLHAGHLGPYFEGADGRTRFDAALRELRDRDLLWTDYKVGAIPGGDAYGMHATELGWLVIESRWMDLRRKPDAATNHGLQPTAAGEIMRPPRLKPRR